MCSTPSPPKTDTSASDRPLRVLLSRDKFSGANSGVGLPNRSTTGSASGGTTVGPGVGLALPASRALGMGVN